MCNHCIAPYTAEHHRGRRNDAQALIDGREPRRPITQLLPQPSIADECGRARKGSRDGAGAGKKERSTDAPHLRLVEAGHTQPPDDGAGRCARKPRRHVMSECEEAPPRACDDPG